MMALRRLKYIPAVDGLRALAIVMVMAHHAIIPHEWFDGARGSVDVFFAISGFLITSLVVNEFDKEGRVDLRRFYRRRAYRLLPAVTIAIIGIAAYATIRKFVDDTASPIDTYKSMVFAAVYVSNWAWAFGADLPIEFIHLWTLSVEEQFYVVAPISLAIALPRVQRKTIIVSMAVLACAGLAWRSYLFTQDVHHYRLRFGLDTHAESLLLGCIIGMLYASGMGGRLFEASTLKKRVGTAMLLALIAMTFVDIHRWPGQEWWAPAVWACMGAIAVLSVINQPDGWHVRMLELPFVQRIGKVSYALYLWHLPVQFWVGRIIGFDKPLVVRTAIAWVIAYGMAEASWRLVELPAQHLRQRREATRAARHQSVGT